MKYPKIILTNFEEKVLVWIAIAQKQGAPVPKTGYSWITIEGNFSMTIDAPDALRSLRSLGLVKLNRKNCWILTKIGEDVFREIWGNLFVFYHEK